jgi:hypothetical protein
LIVNSHLLSIFPNPTSSELNIKSHDQKEIHYCIYNTVGQILKEGTINSYLTTIGLGNLSDGLYNIVFSTFSKIERRSFILEK